MKTTSRFLDAMASGACVIASRHDNETRAIAVPSVASYSIDPPSIIFSVPTEIAGSLAPRFGVSLLAGGQAHLAQQLWETVAAPEGSIVRDGAVLVPDALAHLTCRPERTEIAFGRALVVATVLEVTVRPGLPLMWVGGGLRREAVDGESEDPD